jgi:hypothetical protein
LRPREGAGSDDPEAQRGGARKLELEELFAREAETTPQLRCEGRGAQRVVPAPGSQALDDELAGGSASCRDRATVFVVEPQLGAFEPSPARIAHDGSQRGPGLQRVVACLAPRLHARVLLACIGRGRDQGESIRPLRQAMDREAPNAVAHGLASRLRDRPSKWRELRLQAHEHAGLPAPARKQDPADQALPRRQAHGADIARARRSQHEVPDQRRSGEVRMLDAQRVADPRWGPELEAAQPIALSFGGRELGAARVEPDSCLPHGDVEAIYEAAAQRGRGRAPGRILRRRTPPRRRAALVLWATVLRGLLLRSALVAFARLDDPRVGRALQLRLRRALRRRPRKGREPHGVPTEIGGHGQQGDGPQDQRSLLRPAHARATIPIPLWIGQCGSREILRRARSTCCAALLVPMHGSKTARTPSPLRSCSEPAARWSERVSLSRNP